MDSAPQPMIRQMLDWWALAGLDSLVSDCATPWLNPRDEEAIRPAASPSVAPRAEPAGRPHTPVLHDTPTPPKNVSEYMAWINDPATFAALDPGLVRFAPRGVETPRLLIFVDQPEEGDPHAGRLLNGAVGSLLDAMMAAIGLNERHLLISSLLPVYRAGGRIAPELASELARAAALLMQLATPKGVLILGDATSRALIGSGVMESRQNLHFINHGDGKVPAIATFHPRFLIQKPAAKGLAWQDLQLLRSQLEQ